MSIAAAMYMEETLREPAGFAKGSDCELAARCGAGDRSAMREIYSSHKASVYGVVARMISNDADREELVQDVFLQVFKSLCNFRGTSKLSTWIHKVAVNVTLQHIRKKGRRVRIRLDDKLEEHPAAGTDHSRQTTPEDDALLKERQEAVRRALDCLAPKKRIVLVLADFEGMSSKEIAKIVGAPALTVRTRLFYARKTFYARLSAEPTFDNIPAQGGDR
jgi:RNA polymerase sigma-70 factor (ECF subfamily)